MSLDKLQLEELWYRLNIYIEENYVHEKLVDASPKYYDAMEEDEACSCDETPKEMLEEREAQAAGEPARQDGINSYFCCSLSLNEKASIKQVDSLAELLHHEELTFSEKLFQLIAAKKLDEVEVYTASCIDRRLFSKLRRKDYQPSKNTVLALIIGMKLKMLEAKELLEYAGYALAPSNKTDIIISFFLESPLSYDIDLVNEALYKHGQKVLGNNVA